MMWMLANKRFLNIGPLMGWKRIKYIFMDFTISLIGPMLFVSSKNTGSHLRGNAIFFFLHFLFGEIKNLPWECEIFFFYIFSIWVTSRILKHLVRKSIQTINFGYSTEWDHWRRGEVSGHSSLAKCALCIFCTGPRITLNQVFHQIKSLFLLELPHQTNTFWK